MGFFTRTASQNKTAASSRKSFFSLPSISTSNSSLSHSLPSDEDARSVSIVDHRGKLKLQNFSSGTTEPTTSDSASESEQIKIKSFSSAEAPTIRSRNNSGTRPPINPTSKIGSAATRSRSGMSALSRSSRKSLQKSRSNKKKSKKPSKKAVAEFVQEPVEADLPLDAPESLPKDEPEPEEVKPVAESVYRVKLEKDMTLLADAIHLDNNTRTLLASYDAKTIEDFFMMGETDFQHLLAKARNSNRGLPPLQIRKVRILREWITDLINATHPDVSSFLPWETSATEKNSLNVTSDSLLPKDWKRRFQQDLPKLKKKLRRKGDSLAEVFPWLSWYLGLRDSFCGTRY
jgi:hypothetical protein